MAREAELGRTAVGGAGAAGEGVGEVAERPAVEGVGAVGEGGVVGRWGWCGGGERESGSGGKEEEEEEEDVGQGRTEGVLAHLRGRGRESGEEGSKGR